MARVKAITGFLYEIGLLKRYPRTGWLQLGVRTPESVADHSFRASVAASVIASLEGADPQRAAFLALWHDSQETRTTDLPHLAQRYVAAAPHEQVTDDQVRPLPPALAGLIRDAVREYEACQTPEARCARDADKLEMLLQAREYEDQGHRDVRPWIDSALSAAHRRRPPAGRRSPGPAAAGLDRARAPRTSGALSAGTRSGGPDPQDSDLTGSSTSSRETAPCSSAVSSTPSRSRGNRRQWLNTRFRMKTTITVEVMPDPKMIWKFCGKCMVEVWAG